MDDDAIVEAVTRAIHDARFPEGMPKYWTFDEETATGQAYCRRLARAAIAVVREREGWQPIETAPKDGTEVLLAGVCVKPSIDAGLPTVVKAHWTAFNGGGWVWHGAASHFTHWRPLPAPPEAR